MPICNYIDCKERATHNYKDEKERLYCKNHKEINMIEFDQKTKYLSNIIKINFIKTNLSEKKKFNIDFLNKIKDIIQSNSFTTYQDEKIKFLWCLIGSYKNFKQFYIITEIVYI